MAGTDEHNGWRIIPLKPPVVSPLWWVGVGGTVRAHVDMIGFMCTHVDKKTGRR